MSTASIINEANVLTVFDKLEERAVLRSGCPKAGAPVPADEPLNYFHSRVLPGATLRAMARSLAGARIAVDWTTLALASVLFARFDAKQRVSAHMTHRLLVGCVVLAAKTHQDSMPSNGLVGRVVGMSGRELTRLEFALGEALDWRFVVDAKQQEFEDLCAAAAVKRGEENASPYLSISPQQPSPQAIDTLRESLFGANSASSDHVPVPVPRRAAVESLST